jgi:hypothetical protein
LGPYHWKSDIVIEQQIEEALTADMSLTRDDVIGSDYFWEASSEISSHGLNNVCSATDEQLVISEVLAVAICFSLPELSNVSGKYNSLYVALYIKYK